MSNEPLGIVADGQRRSEVYARYIGLRVRRAMKSDTLKAEIDRVVEQRVKLEIEGLVEKRVARQRREIEMLDPDSDRVPIRTIIETVCEATRTKLGEILSPRRSRNVAMPRHLAFWLVREMRPDLSLPQIGRAFKRDHTSIMHGASRVRELRDSFPFKQWLEHPAIVALIAPKAAA